MAANQAIADFSKPRALVLDDHKLYTESFGVYMEQTDIFRSVHCFTESQELINFLVNLKASGPLFCFVDFYLKDSTSLSILNMLKRMHNPLYLIIVSCIDIPVLIREIMLHPIDGFLSKNSGTDEIIRCINSILGGERYITPFISNILKDSAEETRQPFSTKELEVLRILAKGLSSKEAAVVLNLSRHTIVAHKRNMMSKIKTSTLTGLLDYARKIDLI